MEGCAPGEITPVRYRVWLLLPAILLLACSFCCLIRAIEWRLDTRGGSSISNSRDSAGSGSASTPAGSSSSSSSGPSPVLSTAATAGAACEVAASAASKDTDGSDSLSSSPSSSSSSSVSPHVSVASEGSGSASAVRPAQHGIWASPSPASTDAVEAVSSPLQGMWRAATEQQPQQQGEVAAASEALGAVISAVEPVYLAAARDGHSSGGGSEDEVEADSLGIQMDKGAASLLLPPSGEGMAPLLDSLAMEGAPPAESAAEFSTPFSQSVGEPSGEKAEEGRLELEADEEATGGGDAKAEEAVMDDWEQEYGIADIVASVVTEHDSVDDAYRALKLHMEGLWRDHGISDRPDMQQRILFYATRAFITKWAVGSEEEWPTEGAEGEHWHASYIENRTFWRADEQ